MSPGSLGAAPAIHESGNEERMSLAYPQPQSHATVEATISGFVDGDGHPPRGKASLRALCPLVHLT